MITWRFRLRSELFINRPNYDDEYGLETKNDLENNELGDTSEPMENKFDVDIIAEEEIVDIDESTMGDNDLEVGEEYGID